MKGDQARLARNGGGCSLSSSGKTCCGRGERCGKPSCGGE
jgi:hypothetical protein